MAYITQVSTSALTNQNISSALLAHTFTNTTRKRKVYISVDLQQIAGNGDYVVYLTIQRAGAGSAYRTQSTTFAVPSGVTVATFESIALIVGATDVVKVYVTGLAGDTTTPDITTYVDEESIDDASTLTAALVWSYATRTLTTGAVTAANVTNTKITAYRGTTWSIALTDIGALTGYSKLYFTVKKHESDTDAQALVQIEIAGGLGKLNGATYATAADGSITVDDAATGDVTITVKPAATKLLQPATNLFFDFKSVISSVVTIHAAGTLTISADVTRAVS